MLHATYRNSCTRTALHSPLSHDPPAFCPALQQAREDASCTTASHELGVPTFSAQLVMRLLSAARRLLSSPATRAHPGHSAQAKWAGSKSWLTFCAHALRPHRSESCRFQVWNPSPARPRSSFLLGSTWFDDASRASSNHVPAARSGRTAATREGLQHGSETFRLKTSDPAILGLDHLLRASGYSISL